jgi:uncharacterized delta-60 repeat protein
MVTSIGGVPFGSILYIDGVSINDIASYMGSIFALPIPNYYYAVGSFGSFNAPSFKRLVATDLSGSIDTTFNMGVGFNSTVRSMATQSDGKIIVGGDFTTYSGSATNYLIRLNTNGTKDTTFTTPVLNQVVYSIAVQSDNKIIIGGAFTTVSGVASPRIARLDINGARDATFNVGTTGAANIVRDIKIQSDSKVIAVGDFTTYSGSTNSGIVRINPNGTKDTTFNVGAGLSNNAVNVNIQSDGKILVVGAFASYSGSTNNYIVRINTNGTKDTSFTLGTGFNSTVSIAKLRSDGKLTVAGAFTTYSGSSRNYIARLNSNGTVDTGFNVGTGLNAGWGGGLNNSIAFDLENNTYLASDNFTYSGSFIPRIFKVKDNGTLDLTYNLGIGLSRFAIANLVSGSRLYTAGTFVNYQTPGAPGIAMVSDSATLSSSFNPGIGFNGDVYTIARQSDGKVIAGGVFTNYSGSASTRLVRINTNGTLDATFNVGTAGATNLVYDLALQTDGKVVVGGAFTTYSGSSTSTTRLMRLNTNGTQDLTYNTGVGLNSYPLTVLPTADGKVLVLGLFTTYSGSTVNYITRTNANGTRDTTFNTGTGFNAFGYTAVTQSDGKYIVGGSFSTYSGSSANRGIARLNTNGTLDLTFNDGAGFNQLVSAVAMQSDGKIIAGGNFTTYSGSSINRIARLNSDGTLDTTFNVGTGIDTQLSANGIKVDANGIIYCVGNFTTYSGSSVQGIVAINPNGTINQTFYSGLTASFNGTGRGFTINETAYRLIPA